MRQGLPACPGGRLHASEASGEVWKRGGGKRRVERWRCGNLSIQICMQPAASKPMAYHSPRGGLGTASRWPTARWPRLPALEKRGGRSHARWLALPACPGEDRLPALEETDGRIAARSPRVSRHPFLVGLSRPLSPGPHDSSCREVGGYIREGLSEAPPKKRIGALTPRESSPKIDWTFSPAHTKRARLVVPRGRWVCKRGFSRGATHHA